MSTFPHGRKSPGISSIGILRPLNVAAVDGGARAVDLDDKGDECVERADELLVSYTIDSEYFGLGVTVVETDAHRPWLAFVKA